MNEPRILLDRLAAIGESLSKRDTALALVGLGSVGLDLDRLDRFSDLDFFVIVKPGAKEQYLDDLSWLTDIVPVAYHFQNSKDGYKLLYEDGIFCEFAVLEEAELEKIPFAPGRVVWQAGGVSESIAIPGYSRKKPRDRRSQEWLIGEALTNLYVGLQRERRGEKLSAMRFIQGHAVDQILALAERVLPATDVHQDPFSRERRYERRHPSMAPVLPNLLQGYERNRESAQAAILG